MLRAAYLTHSIDRLTHCSMWGLWWGAWGVWWIFCTCNQWGVASVLSCAAWHALDFKHKHYKEFLIKEGKSQGWLQPSQRYNQAHVIVNCNNLAHLIVNCNFLAIDKRKNHAYVADVAIPYETHLNALCDAECHKRSKSKRPNVPDLGSTVFPQRVFPLGPTGPSSVRKLTIVAWL